MEEFRLNVNAYSPEYGRSNGGTVMVIGKSGGNEIHGTLFEFLRNEDLNARNYFARSGRKPEFRRNQYGGTVGGPIRKNKTFFFARLAGHPPADRASRARASCRRSRSAVAFSPPPSTTRHLAPHSVPE